MECERLGGTVAELNRDRERYQRERREQSIRETCHDLRNPIATVSALAAAATHEIGSPEAVLKRLQQIQDETRRMTQLVRQLLEDGTEPRILDASSIAAEVVASCRVTFIGSIRVMAQAGATVLVDEVGLRRSLANLVENATRAAGPEGSVLVRVRRSRGWIHCEVSDSGPGFGKGPAGSASLGLTIVDRLARGHGGRLEILDSSLGGAMLRLSLPAAEELQPALGDALI
jgi:signal transduction histidine kinase